LASNAKASTSRTSARSTRSAAPSSRSTGLTSPGARTSKPSSTRARSQRPTSGSAGSPAKTSPWLAMGIELGLTGSSLDSFTSFLDWLSDAYPGFVSSRTCAAYSLPTEEETSKSLFKPWPNSGIAWDGVCLIVDTSESPSPARESSLWDVIERGEVPQKYFLSPNAARGILRRAKRMGRELFPPLRKALEILSKARS
jgi:hypothetical protein